MPFTLTRLLGMGEEQSKFDPYKRDSDSDSSAQTPSANETVNQTTNAGATSQLSDEGSAINREIEELRKFKQMAEKRFEDKDRFINDLQNENGQLRRGLQSVGAGTPQSNDEDERELMPWEDEGTVLRVRQAMQDDPVKAMQIMYEDAFERGTRKAEQVAKEVIAPYVRQNQNQVALATMERRLQVEFQDAVSRFGEPAKAIVAEFAANNGTSGVLVDRLVSLKLQPLAVEGGVRNVIAGLILEQGNAPARTPEPQTPQPGQRVAATPVARPRANSASNNNTPEPSIEDQVRSQILGARRSASDWLHGLR